MDEFPTPATRYGYRGSSFASARALPLEGGLLRPRRLASLFMAVMLRPRQAVALIALVFRTRSEQVVLSTSLTGQALSAYFDERSFGVFPNNRLCRGVLILPDHHSDYLRGRHRQALRTNLRRAQAAGIRCETIHDARRAFDEVTEIVNHRRTPLTGDEQAVLESWPAMLAEAGMTLVVARDRFGSPLAITGAMLDDAICLIRVAVASSHEARWALHDHLVRLLIARGVRYLVADGGGPFGALGFDTGVQHYQRLLGYELRHLRPVASRKLRPAAENARPVPAGNPVNGSRPLPAASATSPPLDEWNAAA